MAPLNYWSPFVLLTVRVALMRAHCCINIRAVNNEMGYKELDGLAYYEGPSDVSGGK